MAYTRTEEITDQYRSQICTGDLRPGDRMPSSRALASIHGISEPTARKVLSALRVGGYTTTTQRGSYVASQPPGIASAQDRLRRAARIGSTASDVEKQRAISADLVVAPTYIAEIYDIEPGDQVVRREYIIQSAETVIALHVDWYPATFAVQVPALLSTAERTGGELLTAVEQAIGRTVTHGRDAVRGRGADEREADALNLPIGAAILAGAHAWSDDAGLLVYGEWCIPTNIEMGYTYDIEY